MRINCMKFDLCKLQEEIDKFRWQGATKEVEYVIMSQQTYDTYYEQVKEFSISDRKPSLIYGVSIAINNQLNLGELDLVRRVG